MHKVLKVETTRREVLVDVTQLVASAVEESGVDEGLVSVYVRGATGAIMIQENWDDSVQEDVVDMLAQIAPRGVWKHDQQDGNGDSHLKAGIVGPSESVPIIGGKMALSTWQNIFLCEFDGPRAAREIVVTILKG